MLKYLGLNNIIIAFALCLIPAVGFAQQPADTTGIGRKEMVEKEEFSFIPEAIRVGLDVSHLVGNVVDPNRKYYELNTDVSFGRYLLSADWGTGRQYRSADDLDYSVSGSYFRVGPDYNFIADSENNNALFVGLRFGRSSFGEELNTTFTVPGWDVLLVDPNRQTSAHWFEGVGGLKVRVWKSLYLGYTLRLKFGIKVHDDNLFTAYEVPGFGTVGDGTKFSFNYHVAYRFPFRKSGVKDVR